MNACPGTLLTCVKMNKMIVGEMLDGFVTALTFKTLDLIMPDKSLKEQIRYNNAIIGLERERLDWNKRMDQLRNELEQAQLEKNEAKQNELETRIRLSQKPALKYQPSTTFNNLHSSILLVLGVGSGYVVSRAV